MRKIQMFLMFTACLFFATSMTTAQKAKNTMTNADVIKLVKGGLPESTIVLAIQQGEPNFDTSTDALIDLSKQGVGQKILDAMLQSQTTRSDQSTRKEPQTTNSDPPKRKDPTNAIAFKDIGSLRVVLKSVLLTNLVDRNYSRRNGIRCSFEFINLETQRPIVVAMNAIADYDRIGILRSTLFDENGGEWSLVNEYVVGGIGKIGVGRQPTGNLYDPAEIVNALSKRDDLKSDVDNRGFQFIHGSMTELSPEQSVTVTMTFLQNNSQTTAAMKVFQIASEIVVGSITSGSKKSYTLYNLTFDRVNR